MCLHKQNNPQLITKLICLPGVKRKAIKLKIKFKNKIEKESQAELTIGKITA